MRDRFLEASRLLAIVAAVISLGPVTASGQSRPAEAKPKGTAAATKWVVPRTPDGQPDLQGVWLSNSATPLERPKALEGRAFLTDDEVAELKRRAERIFKTGNSDFAAGDSVFLAALANQDQYKNAGATHGSTEMIDREFDNRTSLVVDPPDGRIPPITPDAQRRQVAAAAIARRPVAAQYMTNAHRCISWSVPRIGGRYGAGDLSYYQILQAPGYVVLYFETGHETRIIPLDGRPHLATNVRQWSGDSRGRWEGDTLVVDTTNFSSNSNFMGSAEGLHLIERFTRISADKINYEMTFTDPTTWNRPWTAAMPLTRSRDTLYEFACHEGNYEMIAGMLSAARVDDEAAQKAAAPSPR